MAAAARAVELGLGVAAGADAGGLQGPGYVGGLALGLVLGRRGAEAVHREAMGAAPSAA